MKIINQFLLPALLFSFCILKMGSVSAIVSYDKNSDIRLPVKSQISPGHLSVENAPKIKSVYFSNAFFVVGDDSLSIEWLKKHAKHLQAIKALGFVTNIETTEALQHLETIAGIPLLPLNVDALSEALNVDHYPFVFETGEIWQ